MTYQNQSDSSYSRLHTEQEPTEIQKELELYCKQEKIKTEIANREETFGAEMEVELLAFEESQRRKRDAFEREALARQEDISRAFLHHIQAEGIDEVRKRTVPAYTFTKFPKLPLELRLHIWNLLCRTDEPSTYILVNTKAERSSWGYYSDSVNERSTRCIQPSMSRPQRSVIHGQSPVAVRVCKESRAEAHEVYALILYRAHYPLSYEDRQYDNQGNLFYEEQPGDRMCYINTLYNLRH
ncbi:hypothetical protein IFR05_001436 [Cadophora sp. M221]|nr:hypothetical protein IFR05_001436 [Cadophora sp. M221]